MDLLKDVIERLPVIVVVWVIGSLYVFYKLHKDEVEYIHSKSATQNIINNMIVGALVGIIFTFLFTIFGSMVATILLKSEPVLEKTYRLDTNDNGKYYDTAVKSMKSHEIEYVFKYIDEFNIVNFKYANHDDIQIEYIDDTVEEPYVEVFVYHYIFKPADKTFFVYGGTEIMIKTLYRLHIPKI